MEHQDRNTNGSDAVTPAEKDAAQKWKRRFVMLAIAWVVVMVMTSFGTVRGLLIRPLYVHDPDAQGEIAYVMADGSATWERLLAASDLYHMHRVQEIYLLKELNTSCYNFVRHESDTRFQREIDYLGLRGVPENVIQGVPIRTGDWLSSRGEAEGVANLSRKFDSIVVVTSAPHTRRSKMCFRRAFGPNTDIFVYSASNPESSVETYSPIWIEYAKLAVYWFCA